MNYLPLGSTDLQISEMSFGCMSLKGSHDENAKLLHAAHDLGINYFDTADLYDKGENEISVGKAFKDRRDTVIIATKVGNQWRTDGSGWDWNPRKEYILGAVEDSLRRLQTDYIDVYQLHGGTIDDPTDETIEAFEMLKAQGKVRHYAISSIRPNVIRRFVEGSAIVSNMMQYSLLDRRPEEAMLRHLLENNISVIVRGAVAKGLLIDKPRKHYLEHSEETVKKVQEGMAALKGYSPLELVLGYVRKHPAVTSIALGCRTIEQLQANVTAMKQPELPDEVYEDLQSLAEAKVYEKHR